MGRVWTAVCALAIGLIATTGASGVLAAPAKASLPTATATAPKRKALPAGGDILARPDPSVLRGQLPNGLPYAVMHNATPAKSLSIRFYVQTGSLDESDAERGMAHFLEHMAFEGGQRFATGEALTKSFLEAGVSLGRDQNAFSRHSGKIWNKVHRFPYIRSLLSNTFNASFGTVLNCAIIQNRAEAGGGVSVCSEASAILANCIINENSVTDSEGAGAGIAETYTPTL